MVECIFNLDTVFSSLSDPTRRDILKRVSETELSVNEIAEPYPLSIAAVSKHLKVLELAQLITKRRSGKQKLVGLTPYAFKDATDYLQYYERLWSERFDSLEQYLSEKE